MENYRKTQRSLFSAFLWDEKRTSNVDVLVEFEKQFELEEHLSNLIRKVDLFYPFMKILEAISRYCDFLYAPNCYSAFPTRINCGETR